MWLSRWSLFVLWFNQWLFVQARVSHGETHYREGGWLHAPRPLPTSPSSAPSASPVLQRSDQLVKDRTHYFDVEEDDEDEVIDLLLEEDEDVKAEVQDGNMGKPTTTTTTTKATTKTTTLPPEQMDYIESFSEEIRIIREQMQMESRLRLAKLKEQLRYSTTIPTSQVPEEEDLSLADEVDYNLHDLRADSDIESPGDQNEHELEEDMQSTSSLLVDNEQMPRRSSTDASSNSTDQREDISDLSTSRRPWNIGEDLSEGLMRVEDNSATRNVEGDKGASSHPWLPPVKSSKGEVREEKAEATNTTTMEKIGSEPIYGNSTGSPVDSSTPDTSCDSILANATISTDDEDPSPSAEKSEEEPVVKSKLSKKKKKAGSKNEKNDTASNSPKVNSMKMNEKSTASTSTVASKHKKSKVKASTTSSMGKLKRAADSLPSTLPKEPMRAERLSERQTFPNRPKKKTKTKRNSLATLDDKDAEESYDDTSVSIEEGEDNDGDLEEDIDDSPTTITDSEWWKALLTGVSTLILCWLTTLALKVIKKSMVTGSSASSAAATAAASNLAAI